MNTTLIKEIDTLIHYESTNIPYNFPDVAADNMILFERTYTGNIHYPILIMVRYDIKDTNNYRTYYLYEKNKKIYEIIIASVNGIVAKYAKPFRYI